MAQHLPMHDNMNAPCLPVPGERGNLHNHFDALGPDHAVADDADPGNAQPQAAA